MSQNKIIGNLQFSGQVMEKGCLGEGIERVIHQRFLVKETWKKREVMSQLQW